MQDYTSNVYHISRLTCTLLRSAGLSGNRKICLPQQKHVKKALKKYHTQKIGQVNMCTYRVKILFFLD
jgi:hypothetical protein